MSKHTYGELWLLQNRIDEIGTDYFEYPVAAPGAIEDDPRLVITPLIPGRVYAYCIGPEEEWHIGTLADALDYRDSFIDTVDFKTPPRPQV